MTTPKVTPGPDAHHAFRLGMVAAAIVALLGVGAVYWAGMMSILQLVTTLVLCFPIYLVFVAAGLSAWLGFGKDATDLRPVYHEKERV